MKALHALFHGLLFAHGHFATADVLRSAGLMARADLQAPNCTETTHPTPTTLVERHDDPIVAVVVQVLTAALVP